MCQRNSEVFVLQFILLKTAETLLYTLRWCHKLVAGVCLFTDVLTVCQRPCDKRRSVIMEAPPPHPHLPPPLPVRLTPPDFSSPSAPRSCFRSASFTSHPQCPLQCRELFVFHKRTLQCQCVYIPCSTIRTTRRCRHRVLLLKQRSLTGLQSDPGPRP